MTTPFTPAQLDAIDVSLRHQDACVVAGPGSGKTTGLVEYCRGLLAAGVSVAELAHFPVPAGVGVDDIEASLDALRNEPAAAWSYQQRQELEHSLEGAERIVAASTSLEALHAVERFSCNLNKCRKS